MYRRHLNARRYDVTSVDAGSSIPSNDSNGCAKPYLPVVTTSAAICAVGVVPLCGDRCIADRRIVFKLVQFRFDPDDSTAPTVC